MKVGRVLTCIHGPDWFSSSLQPVVRETSHNQLHVVAVAVAYFGRIFKAGLGPVAPKKAKKPDWTGL